MQPTHSNNPITSSAEALGVQLQTSAKFYTGPIPPPEVLQAIENIAPGAARELLELTKREAAHICALQEKELAADIATRQKQLAIAEYQTRAAFRSDLIGQIAGLLLSLVCVGAAVYLAVHGFAWVALSLAAIPTAAVIRAFSVKRKD